MPLDKTAPFVSKRALLFLIGMLVTATQATDGIESDNQLHFQ
jgi:hypothetical protein